MDFIFLKEQMKNASENQSRFVQMPERSLEIFALRQVLEGKQYDCLPFPFFMGYADGTRSSGFSAGAFGTGRIPLSQRRPSIQCNISKSVVDDSVSFLFGEGRFPKVELVCHELGESDAASEDKDNQQEALDEILESCHFSAVMLQAAYEGSVGSSAVKYSIIEGEPKFEVLLTENLVPIFSLEDPSILTSLMELQYIKGQVLYEMGYAIKLDERNAYFFLAREFTQTDEIIYKPWPASLGGALYVGKVKDRTFPHNFGFIPVIWIKNEKGDGSRIDGTCTFKAGINSFMEIDYLLSQTARGLKYSSEPLLAIKSNNADMGSIDKSSGDSLVLPETGDAKLIEMSGDSVTAIKDFVGFVRDLALTSVHGNRVNPDKIHAAQSAKAMELLYHPLICLADRLRLSYGDGIKRLIEMLIASSAQHDLKVNGDMIPSGFFHQNMTINLKWPDWFPETVHDRQAESSTLKTLTDINALSQKAAMKVAAGMYDIEDVEELESEIKEDIAQFQAMQPQVTETKAI
ncbi:MAG: phage portal protein [Pseudomonadota bacterium]